ncbi:Glutamyl-tRNA(Gln) amidotransferase subunit A [Anatilimnocola aggregata]|uniref:Glutamyl-tRNA(Gln) amidotransferase subunit A n=1 Tax=Anatilimnocola aggregata TaxID=2528021 RepID=A0A517YJS7_9BACT|nr:amidase [Anatilimnocola aggregata]QDU30484.1 Glutamyl-tRNA(Gln) amidotransferase subunit A [Anatilimnocola aggregata]
MPDLPTIARAAELIRDGVLRPLDLVEQCLANIDQYEPAVQAWVTVDRAGALKEAKRLGATLADGEEPASPLFGIPIGIKDIIDVAGMPTRCGSPLRGKLPATKDAPVVAALREAGAILLGKTVTTQFAAFDPPPTKNPWNAAHTPGGSSSGSAAAVAMEMCFAALGTQTGGSITRPASYCGVAGFKPPWGEVSLEQVEPLSFHLDHVGPIARRVSDLYLVWQQLAARASGGVDASVTRPWAEHDLEYWLDCYGVYRTLFVVDSPLLEQADPLVQATTAAALERLRASFEVRKLSLPASFNSVLTWHKRIMVVEAAEHHRAEFKAAAEKFGPCITTLIQEGLGVSAVDYCEALRMQNQVRNELAQLLHSQGDLLGCLVMPATTTPAPDASTTGNPAFNAPWSFLGLPTITIPCGLAANGLPCGLQFIAFTSPQVFAMAGMCERILHQYARPPLLETPR